MESVYLAGKAWLLPAALWLAVGMATVWWAYRGASWTAISAVLAWGLNVRPTPAAALPTRPHGQPGTRQARRNRLALLADTNKA